MHPWQFFETEGYLNTWLLTADFCEGKKVKIEIKEKVHLKRKKIYERECTLEVPNRSI